MIRVKNEPYFSISLVFCLIIFLSLFGCSNQTSTGSSTVVVSSANSSSISQLAKDTVFSKNDLTQVYSQAIGEYIRLVKRKYNITFDTLFFGKHEFGQPDDFPDIVLPALIENTSIQLISPEQGKKIQEEHKWSYYINLMGWVNSVKAQFVFVAFSNGFAHQFDCYIDYQFNEKKQVFEVENFRFESFQSNVK